MGCPKENSKEWKDLLKYLGNSRDRAMAAFNANGEVIPSKIFARKLHGIPLTFESIEDVHDELLGNAARKQIFAKSSFNNKPTIYVKAEDTGQKTTSKLLSAHSIVDSINKELGFDLLSIEQVGKTIAKEGSEYRNKYSRAIHIVKIDWGKYKKPTLKSEVVKDFTEDNKPEVTLDFLNNKQIVNMKDYIKVKESQDIIKQDLVTLRKIINCLWKTVG